jgi:restriction endonuclease S subunit
MIFEQCETMFAGAPSAFFEKETVQQSDHKYCALKGSDLLSDGYISTENLQRIEVKEGKKIDKFLLKAGDVVLLARGQSMKCCIVTEEVAKHNLIATANFIVIRIKIGLKAEFLVSYLNSPLGKKALNHSSVSSSTNVIKSISLSGLKKIYIKFPTVEVQSQISGLFHAGIAANRATLMLAEQQKKTVEAKVLNLIEAT